MMLASQFGIIPLAGSIAVGLIFLESGFGKLRHRKLLPGIVANYRLLPAGLVGPFSVTLPSVEIMIGAALLVNLAPATNMAGASLLGLFALAMAINLGRGRRDISCGCGRPDLGHRISWELVLRNLALAALLLVPRPSTAGLTPLDVGMAIAAGLGIYLVYALFEAIARLAATSQALSRR
jgi:K+-transporting ATPase KdpF subunit